MKEFTVTFTIGPKDISTLLWSALEGGSDYWIESVQKVKPSSWEFDTRKEDMSDGAHYLQDYPLNPGGSLIITDTDKETYILNDDALQHGLTMLQQKYPHRIAQILEGNTDAETGDVFLQCCLYGEIVYC